MTVHRKIFYAIACVAVVIVSLTVLDLIGVVHIYHRGPRISGANTPIKELPSKESVAASNKLPAANTSISQGSDTDENGKTPSSGNTTNQSKWTTSESGLITVKQPTNNGSFVPGDTIYGTASNGVVSYTLIDNNVGVVSQGIINVVNGNFSATINFKSYASSGRLDVYNTQPNGKEINLVQVSVNF